METIYIFFIGAIGIIIAIGLGLEMSSGIDEFVIYILFWMLYIVTIATFINIILVVNYYITMKDKTGPPGLQGPVGDQGDSGQTGLCDPGCRDSICENKIIDMLSANLKKNGLDDPKTRFNNIYIKSKVRQMCASDEFKQLSPHNGPKNLQNYLVDIWKIWFDILYEAGGMKYFENISAETEFEWMKDNPFQELKQYDVFYWGMGSQYRPQINDKCYSSSNGLTPNEVDINKVIRASVTTLYESLGKSASGSEDSVSFWRASQYTFNGAVYYPVGDLAIGPIDKNNNRNLNRYVGSITIGNSPGPQRETIIVSGDVVGPIDYDLIWTNNKFWIWRPIAPLDYISLGDIVTFSERIPLTGNRAPIRCVPYNITIRMNPNGNLLWSSYGSNTPTHATILGFTPNDGSFVDSGLHTSTLNCYNMFRTVIGLNSTNIPESDINGGFYYLDSNKYDSGFTIGSERGSVIDEKNKVGKGYLKFPKKDSKYSVLSYLNLKNNPVLKHQMTNTQINCQLIENAISNAYLVSTGTTENFKNCLNFNGKKILTSLCDDTIDNQIFNIIFTGNMKNECKLRHNSTQKLVIFKNNVFTLVDPEEQTNIEYQLFTMQ
jgi:hypothetical protein